MPGRFWMLMCLIILPLGSQSHAQDQAETEFEGRVALVLSGGGARGAAHVGVLRVMEELNIPVDMIVGTSGGAIIGGLYAGGWSPDEIAEWLDTMDWEVALSDRLPRRRLAYRAKQDDARFLFDLEIGVSEGRLTLPQALIEGRNLAFILEQATSRTAEIDDFDRLPIPFRAVATDLESGDKVILDKGRLSHAIRASMAVPGVFSPVELDGRLLADGGLAENLPVSVALDMGADVIIAVNVGAKLLEREQLGDIFALSGQVTSLITHRNARESMGLLEPQDVLIEPELEGIGGQQFERSREAAAHGERAARQARSQLETLSRDEATFERFLERQRRPSNEIGTLEAIRISGLQRLSENRVLALMETREGEELALDRLQSDLGRLQRMGEIAAVDFRTVESENGITLELNIRERDRGLHHVRLGLEVFDEFDGSAQYNLRMGHTRPSINRLGAEWRNEAQIGRQRGLRTEFYQPLSPGGRLFLALPAFHEAETFAVYDEGEGRAEFSRRRTRAGIDLGSALGPHGELRLGAWRSRISSESRIGDGSEGGLERDLGGWRVALNFDRLDDAEWPQEGQLLSANLEGTRTGWGADQSYRLATAEYAQYWAVNQNRLLLGMEWGEFNAPLPFQQHLELGGPFSISGYRRGELRGERVAALRGLWFRQLGSADVAGRGGALYAGIGLASGGAWQHGEGFSSDKLVHGGKAFLGADTPLGPAVFGLTLREDGDRGVFLTLGLPIHRPRPASATW
ncbi:patatin-like phospholipase family protein [Natronospira bacteriovora]|uniref:Patatin-like phospholipase family protein n=1 Tax=Natronospira bacteriovora TaxID=3069753 RepID=A0ABU0WBC8_9GAMM|nr:patatin-like phospholipase family protein [Natronospira sp. AB-CW4]MDQ2070765.1 patatin-like phospholipase family protein [Natronospira sp. AB-CW4]